jgi:hypothetical protein
MTTNPNELTEEMIEKAGYAVACSLWGEAQAFSFFELGDRNVHKGKACDAARAAIAAMQSASPATSEDGFEDRGTDLIADIRARMSTADTDEKPVLHVFDECAAAALNQSQQAEGRE